MNTLEFSNFDSIQFDAISDLLCTTFNTSKRELVGLYDALKKDFDKADWPSPIFADKRFFMSDEERFRGLHNGASTIACDLPSLLSRGGKSTVMIIAQDPYSKEHTDRVIVGTPYALHIKHCREDLRNTRLYFQLIDVLLQNGFQTYLTDLYKVYADGLKFPPKDRQRFAQLLRDEVDIVDPVAVITWGKIATNAVRKLNLGRPHYEYPHPSGAARGAWARLMNISATDDNIINYWQKSITQQLNR